MVRSPARRAILPACLAVVAALADAALGGTGTLLTLPVAPNATAKGLRLTVDCRWVHGYSYRPVRVEVTSARPAPADRRLAVEIGLSAWDPSKEHVTVAADIEIPAGSTTVSRTIGVPQLTASQHISLRVWEDGVPIKELTAERRSLGASGAFGWATEAPTILFVSQTDVDVSAFDMVRTASGTIPGNRARDVPWFDERKPAELPEDWIHYSALDVVFISLADANDLSAKRPAAWAALRAWTKSGGNLCVFGAGHDWSGLETIETLLGCPATDQEAADPKRGWQTPSVGLFKAQVLPAILSGSAAVIDPSVPQPGSIASPIPIPATSHFVWKSAALGRVAAIASDQPYPGESAVWRWLFASLGADRTTWTARHGAVPDQDNPNFNDFLIADVGLPPIRAYQVLITLFVVGIGPVNYWVLKRYGRLHLFLFTVPAAALVTSAALLAYALVADGLSSRLRARSLTHLDQRTGEAFRVARLSYYAGLAPSAGLEFPADVAVAPLELVSTAGPFDARNRRLVWTDAQHLTRGWLGSRMPTQLVSVRAEKTDRELAIVPGPDAARTIVRNRLGAEINQLVLCDAAGKLHHAARIAPGAERTLTALAAEHEIAAVLPELLQTLSRDAPALPDAMIAAPSRRRSFFMFSRPRYHGAQSAAAETSRSLLEVELTEIRAALASRTLAPRSYVAIVERPEEIAAGAGGMTGTQSLHVIRGTW
jgi:hypothetical protein